MSLPFPLSPLWSNPLLTPRQIALVLRKIDRPSTDACWPWTAATRWGYGHAGFKKCNDGVSHNWRAHRLAFELAKGPIPDGLLVCHRCDNPRCCNPSHLFLGSASDNVRDCVQKGRRAKKRGTYNGGETNSHAKMTERTARTILRRVHAGESQTEIAKSMLVDKGTIWRLVHGHTWKHLHQTSR